MWWLALGAGTYSILRLVEAIGLWNGRRWAEWYGAATGLIYVPFEAMLFMHRPGAEPAVALIINLAIVAYLAKRLANQGRL